MRLAPLLALGSSLLLSGFAQANNFNITLFNDFYLIIDSVNNAQGKPMIRYQLDMPKESYLGVGYGTSMDKVDMVAFVSSASNPHVEDLFATSESRPPNDM